MVAGAAVAGHATVAVAVGVAVGGGDGDVDSFEENSACTSVGHQLRGQISRKLAI